MENADDFYKVSSESIDWLGSVSSSLRRYTKKVQRDPVLQVVVRYNRDAAVFRALHSDIAEWQRWASDNTTTELDFVERSSSQAKADNLLLLVDKIRAVWTQPPMPLGTKPQLEKDVESIAAAISLLNITLSRAHDFFTQRPDVVAQLISDQNIELEQPALFLPRPPGLKIPEAMLKHVDRILHISLVDDDSEPSISGLSFGEPVPDRSGKLQIRKASLQGLRSLIDCFNDSNAPYLDTPGDIARAYVSFFKSINANAMNSEDAVLLPSAYSFFLGKLTGELVHHVISWTAPAARADDFATIRRHGALTPTPIYRDGAVFWRFGWALCDAFDYAEDIQNSADLGSNDTLDTSDVPQEHPEQLARALVKNAFVRITGPDGYGAGKPAENGIPSRIARGLQLLEAFQEAKGIEWTASGRAQAGTIGLITYADGVDG